MFGFGSADASNNAFKPPLSGELVVRDNDRPNVFLRAVDEKSPSTKLAAPSNVLPAKYGANWFNLALGTGSEENHAGVAEWSHGGNLALPQVLTDFGPECRQLSATSPVDVRAILAKELPNGTATLEIDIPVLFRALMSDNVGAPVRVSFLLKNSTGSLLADMSGAELYRYIFREAGNYEVEVEITDTAKAWPSNFHDPTNAGPEVNHRTLKAVVHIRSSHLDVRVIDKDVR